MKYLFLLFLIFSCSKGLEERCFINEDEKYFATYEEPKTFTAKDILENKPDYLEVINLKNFRSFKHDSLEAENLYNTSEKSEKYWKEQKVLFADFKEKFFGQFTFSNLQQVGNAMYAFGENRLGFWLCKIENEKASAYFLGLSFSHYYINKIQEKSIINNGFLELEGSFVEVVEVPGLPGYDDYSAIEDGKLFKIKLEDLVKDSDNDGYNDIFENCFGLNPDNSDTDGDGLDDFHDLNPMFESENNKFTQLYEILLPDYVSENLSNKNYYFEIFISDCDYFHQVNPKYHVLFIPENLKSKTNYQKITDVSSHGIGRIKRNKNNPTIFYIKKWGNSSSTEYSAEYKKGKWILETVGGYVI